MADLALPPEYDRTSSGSRTPLGTAVRTGAAFALGLLVAVLFVSARTEAPTGQDRIGTRIELAQLIREEQARATALGARVEELAARVEGYERSTAAAEGTAALQDRIDEVAAYAGMTGLRGPGLSVALNDSLREPSEGSDPNDLVIHEQDLHAVINALWAGGAEAMSVNGERVLTTSAIRCVGSVLLVHGRTYSPPYVIDAVGDEQTLADALARDPAVEQFAAAAREFDLGFDVEPHEELWLNAYTGTAPVRVARPADGV